MQLPGVIVTRSRGPAPAVSGDPFRSAPADVPDTVHVVRPWTFPVVVRRTSPWWLAAAVLSSAPALAVWSGGGSRIWVAVLLAAPLWFMSRVARLRVGQIRATARLAITRHELRVRSAPWRRWQRLPVHDLFLLVRADHDRDGFALLAIRPDAEPVRLMVVDDLDIGHGLQHLIEKELGHGDHDVT